MPAFDEPGVEVNPAAVAAMAQRGTDISGEFEKPWIDETVRAADVVTLTWAPQVTAVIPRPVLVIAAPGRQRPRKA
jgi:protein-tyrosine-phosphatase